MATFAGGWGRSDGGAWGRMFPLFKAGIGGTLGSGRQYWSWITLRDEVAALEYLVTREDMSGPVNLTAQEPMTNAAITKAGQNLDAILAVGYRVRSPRGVQFRRWASTVLKEFLLKGFVMDDERLKNPDGRPDYFDEMLARIRDIRASEKRFYQKVRDLFALSSDYDKTDRATQVFVATVQNLLIFAVPMILLYFVGVFAGYLLVTCGSLLVAVNVSAGFTDVFRTLATFLTLCLCCLLLPIVHGLAVLTRRADRRVPHC
jgi:hypothetical protein